MNNPRLQETGQIFTYASRVGSKLPFILPSLATLLKSHGYSKISLLLEDFRLKIGVRTIFN